MRTDKLTTKFQEALADAQSLALGHDNAYIEPAHLLAAMLKQDDGPRALLQRAGVNTAGLQAAAEQAIKRLPSVSGASGAGLVHLVASHRKRSHQAGRSIHCR